MCRVYNYGLKYVVEVEVAMHNPQKTMFAKWEKNTSRNCSQLVYALKITWNVS
jgi:hypothetical protein